MVIKKIETRDYLRKLITRANKEAGVTYNASKLNSKEECEEYLLNLIKNLKHKKQDNKAYVKEIDSLKEEIEILNKNLAVANREKVNLKDKSQKLEAERILYITQAKEAGEKREEAEKEKEYYRYHAKYWNNSYYEKDDKLSRVENLNFLFGALMFIEVISIAMLLWK